MSSLLQSSTDKGSEFQSITDWKKLNLCAFAHETSTATRFFNRFLPHALLKQRYVLVLYQIGVLEGSDSSDVLFHTIDLYLYCLSESAKYNQSHALVETVVISVLKSGWTCMDFLISIWNLIICFKTCMILSLQATYKIPKLMSDFVSHILKRLKDRTFAPCI